MAIDRTLSTAAVAKDANVEDRVLSEPVALRALAHPTRLAILEHLRVVDSATASDLAATLGAVPSACSFHLRVLQRFGFVEEDPDGDTKGRRRPWRACRVRLGIATGANDPAASEDLLRSWDTMRQELDAARRAALERDADFPTDWRHATGGDRICLRVTPAELSRLRWAITSLCGGMAAKGTEDPSLAQPVDVAIDYVPRFAPEDLSSR